MTRPAILVANHRIDARLVEFDARIIHHPGHGHEIEIGPDEDEPVRDIDRAQVDIHDRTGRHGDFFRFEFPHPGHVMQLVMRWRMRDQLALLERLHTRQAGRQADVKDIDRERCEPEEQHDESDRHRKNSFFQLGNRHRHQLRAIMIQ